MTRTGPLGGLTSDLLCPGVCVGCQGPYTHLQYSRNDSSVYDVVCDNARHEPSKFERGDAFSYSSSHPEQHLPGGGWTLIGVAFFAYLPLALVLSFFRSVSVRVRMRRRAAEFDRQIASAERELRSLGGDPRADDVIPKFQPRRALLGLLLILLPILLMGGCLGVNLGLRAG